MNCICQLEASHKRYFRLVGEMLPCKRKNSDRYLGIEAHSVLPYEQRLVQFLEHQEHDENVLRIVHI